MDFSRVRSESIIFLVMELLIGILLLINPVGFTAGIIFVAGAGSIVFGITFIVKYFRAPASEAALTQDFLIGLIGVLLGAFCIIKNEWIVVRALPVLTLIYGLIVLLSGLKKTQTAVNMIRMKYNKWGWSLIGAVIFIVCGIIIITNPFATTYVLWNFIGITMIAGAVIDLVAVIFR